MAAQAEDESSKKQKTASAAADFPSDALVDITRFWRNGVWVLDRLADVTNFYETHSDPIEREVDEPPGEFLNIPTKTFEQYKELYDKAKQSVDQIFRNINTVVANIEQQTSMREKAQKAHQKTQDEKLEAFSKYIDELVKDNEARDARMKESLAEIAELKERVLRNEKSE